MRLTQARESEDLPADMSLPDREGGMVGTAARAVGRNAPKDPFRLASVPHRVARRMLRGLARGVGDACTPGTPA
jgi:hypothetical protein